MIKHYISRFTPSSMPPATLEAMFVEREPLAERVLELIYESATTGAKHQTLLIGQRGLGKTHFVSIIYARLKKQEGLQEKLRIAWLREEEWGVASFLDLLVCILKALAQEYLDKHLVEQINQLFDLPANQAEKVAGVWLKEWLEENVLLLIIENLDTIFEGLGDLGQKRFRAYLQENNFCTVLATSQGLFNGVSTQKSPFYGFFRIQHLQELDVIGAGALLQKLATLEGKDDLVKFIESPIGKARINAAHHLAGGCHRIYVIFYQFLTRQSLDELVTPFMELLDELTPYYQARMSYLSPQQRKIIEVLYGQRSAMTVKEIARRCFITHPTTSGQLKDLQEKGYVRNTPVGREAWYEMKEPLMRLCLEVKQVRGEPIRLFVNFLKIWYSSDELRKQLRFLPEGAIAERSYITQALQEIPGTPDLNEASQLSDQAKYLASQRCYEEAIPLQEQALTIFRNYLGEEHPTVAFAYNNLAILYDFQGQYKQAEATFQKALDLFRKLFGEESPNVASSLNNLAVVYNAQGRSEDAESHYKKALSLYNKISPREHSEIASCLNNLAVLYDSQGRHTEAELLYKEALVLERNIYGSEDPRIAMHLNNLGGMYASQQHFELAESLFQEVLTLCSKHSKEMLFENIETLANLGMLYLKQQKWRLAFHSYEQGIMTAQNTQNQRGVLSILQKKFKGCFKELAKSNVDAREIEDWLGLWRSVSNGRAEFEITLRLLEALWQFRKTDGDVRVLLELPVEERVVMEDAMANSKWSTSKKLVQ
jgi:tetratricopeptide (TPR) repeat protein